jgi:hypothetical protein
MVTRRAHAHANCDHGKDQRAAIRQHVGSLGQQGDGVGPESPYRFYECKGCQNGQGNPQAALARGLAFVVMAMIVVMATIMAMVCLGGHVDRHSMIGTPGTDTRRNVLRPKTPWPPNRV